MIVYGHQRQRKLLEDMVVKGSIPHAILMSGPEKVGKKRVAIELVKKLNSQSDSEEIIEKREYPDFFSIEQDSEIKISQIREVQEKISLTKRGKNSYKAVLIDNAHLLNKEAQSALLKTLEEPKGKIVILLITEYPERLFPTIRSRCWQIKFGLVKEEEMSNLAEKIDIPIHGRPGLLIDLLEDKSFRKKYETLREEFQEMLESSIAKKMEYVKKKSKSKEEVRCMLKIWLFCLKEKMMEEMKKDEMKDETLYMIKNIEKVLLLNLTTNTNTRLSLEKIILNI